MQRLALCFGLLAPLLLTGCSGFWVFMDDTHDPVLHPNRPIGNSENMRVVEDGPVTEQPLKTEPGNVWPGPFPPAPTLEQLAKNPMAPVPPLEPGVPSPANSALPTLVVPSLPHHLQPEPGAPAALVGPLGGAPPAPTAPVVNTLPPAPTPGQASPPNAALGITVPNGNGTSTVIAPDGTITTIPTPK